MFKRVFLLVAVGVALVGFATAVACGDDDDDEVEAGEAEESGGADAQAVALAIREIDSAGFHDTEEAIADGEIPATARNTALQIEALIRLTAWPDDLEDQALELAETLNEAAAAYDEGDAEEALPHAEAVHDGQHDFSPEVYAYLGEEAGVAELIGGHGDDADGEPEATESTDGPDGEATDDEPVSEETEEEGEGH